MGSEIYLHRLFYSITTVSLQKMKAKSKFVGILAVLLVVWGCGRQRTDFGGTLPVDELPSSFVMAKVGDFSVTVGDFRNRYLLETNLLVATRKARDKTTGEKDFYEYAARRKPVLFGELVNQRLVDSYLRSRAIDAETTMSTQRIARLRKNLKFKGSDEGLAKSLGVALPYLQAQISVPDRIRLAREDFDPSCRTVTEKEVDEGRARQDAYKVRAVASNAVVHATCSNVLVQIRLGADFAEIGRKVTEGEVYEADEWDSFTGDEIENQKFREWAFETPVGGVGGPFELDGMFSLVKILERWNEKDGNGALRQYIRVARIAFHVADEEPEPFTRDYVRRTLLGLKADEAQKRFFERQRVMVGVTYPSGTNFVFNLTNRKSGVKQ